MLETTFSSTFVPGSNLKGQVAGANWAFLLPNLELEQVLCIGAPLATTLQTLSGFCKELTVICTGTNQMEALDATGQAAGLPNVRTLKLNNKTGAPFPNHTVDLVLVADRQAAQWLSRDATLLSELRRILKPEAVIYYEYSGLVDPMRRDPGLRNFIQDIGAEQQFWLTTLQGEMRTAVPLSDDKTIGYFLRHNLYASSVNMERWLKRLWRTISRRQGKAPSPPSAPQLSVHKTKRRAPSAASRLGSTAKHAGSILLRLWDPTEDVIDRLSLRSRLSRRHGVVVGGALPSVTQQPPQYLYSIAKTANIALDHYRWGLVAQGNYSSRKLLFFLFDPKHKSAHSTPQYIVKIVRDPVLNARLENECQALVWLQNHGFGARAIVPQVAFSGHHAGLAIVGETVIDGAPFRQKSQATVDCPFAHAAITWLADLGAATANSTVATPGQVVESLHRLLAQFADIYQPTGMHHAFLADQIAVIGNSEAAMPLVFQHGDPGPWNILVTGTNQVAFLDWEASEIQGMPLWDLFYFLRSYCIGAARKRGIRSPLAGFRQLVMSETPFSHLVVDATARYCERIDLPRTLIEPLFYTCWMHRALKEALRLPPTKVESGHYFNLLRLCIAQRSAPALTRLFAR